MTDICSDQDSFDSTPVNKICLGPCGCRLKQIWRLSVIRAPVTVYISSLCQPLLVSLLSSLSRCASSLSSLISHPYMLLCCTQALCSYVERDSPVIRESTRRSLYTSEVLWIPSAISIRFGILVPDLLAPTASSFLSLHVMLSSISIFRRNLFEKAYFNGPMYPPNPGTVRMRYCHSDWSNIASML